MVQDVEKQLLLLKHNLPLFAELFLKIVDTEGNLVPLIFNKTQLTLHNFVEQQLKDDGMVRVVIPKGRKQGVSTYTAARFLHKALFSPHKKVFILSHHSDTTKELFGIVNRFYKHLPSQLKAKLVTDNTKELEFDNGSNYSVATAGHGEIGRGATPHYFHGSEVASYENEDAIETGVFRAIASAAGTEMFLESTAKGIGNLFHRYAITALEGRGRFKLCFLPWYIHEDNASPCPEGITWTPEEQNLQTRYNLTSNQLYWRRLELVTMTSKKFMQEYPATMQEAFQASGNSFLDADLVHDARKSQITDKNKPLVIGVDPARKGDRTVITWRRGRHWEKYTAYEDMDEMRLAGILAKVINDDKPQKVFVDVALGYGTIDRLHELGFTRIVQGVHASESPANPEVHGNKRAEMAFEMRDWFREGEVRIPDSDDVELDLLCIPEEKENSSGRLFMESKDKIKKRFGKSPDIYDSFALTFAYPVRSNIAYDNNMYYNGSKPKQKQEFSSRVMNDFQRGRTDKTKGYGVRWDF